MSAVRLSAFSDRPAHFTGATEVSRFSCMLFLSVPGFFDYHRQHGLRIKVARIFNTYGPRMHPNDGRVVSNFIVQALRGEPKSPSAFTQPPSSTCTTSRNNFV